MRYSELPNERVTAANGIDYAYRDAGAGEGTVPLILLQHFRGNLDNWDPALIDALARARGVLAFDNAGVGGSAGTTPDTIERMARDAIALIAAMELSQVDLLGFSIGSFVAQQIALVRPAIVRRLVLASSAPQGAAGMHGWASEVIGAIGTPTTSPDAYLEVFFAASAASRQAGQESLRRMHARTADRDRATTWATREAQYDAVCNWGIPNHALLQRLSALGMPVFVANGDSDPMILPRYSHDAGIPCPSAADPKRNPHRTGAGWTLRTVAAILSNPRYTGRQVWNRQRTDFDLVDPANTGLGHKQVQRWNLPEGWVISNRPAHPALVSEADFIAAQDATAPRGPAGPATRRYLLAGLLACGRCGRRLESAWSNGRPAYPALGRTQPHPRPAIPQPDRLTG